MWVEPLELKTWLVNILAGDATYFSAIAIFVIISLSAYFRMNGIALGFLVLLFGLMFLSEATPALTIFVVIIAALIVGYVLPKIVKRT